MRFLPLLPLLLLAGAAHATPLGLATALLGDPAAPSVGFAHWDTFPGLAFTADAPDVADGDVFTASLSSALAGGLVLGGGDRLYSGLGPTPFAHALTLTGTTRAAVESLVLQVKFTAPSGGLDPVTFFQATTDFAGTPTAFLLGTSAESQTFQVVQFTWEGLSLAAGQTFTFGLSSPANHVSIDGLRLDAAAVPEPGTWASLAALAALTFAVLHRRR